MSQTLINDIKIINLPLFEHNTKGMLIPTDFDYLPIEIKTTPVNKKPVVYAANISMKQRGLNLINK